MAETLAADFHWRCRHTWRASARNTLWCLVGCAIGDFGTIGAFQIFAPQTNPLLVMALAMVNGILTSIALETVILSRSMALGAALRTALGMSLISMLAMELAMNATDYLLTGGARITWWVIAPALLAGFLAAWPYNYWRLKRYGVACH
ncbi:MAG: DUF4396 domain-containing protein [Pseudomonadota bacterium]